MARSTSLASTFGNNSSKRPRRGVAPPTQISRSAIIFGLLNVEGAVSGDSERRVLAGLPFTGASRMLRTTELAGCAFAPGASVSFADLENTRGDMPQVVAWALAPLGLHPTGMDEQGRLMVELMPGGSVGGAFSEFVARVTAVAPQSTEANRTKVPRRMLRCTFDELVFLMEASFACFVCSSLSSRQFFAACGITRTF